MKHKLILLCFLLSFEALSQNEVLTNASIVEMVKGGFSSTTIIKKIKNSRSDFKTTTNDLVQLKKNGVPEDIIETMINPAKSGDDTITEESGVFYEENGKTIKLDPSPIAAGKAKSFGNTVANWASKGLVKKQARLIIEGEHSSIQLMNNRPTFTFIFEKQAQEQGLGNKSQQKKGLMGALERVVDAGVNYRFGSTGSASSPKDFVLAKTLNERDKKTRELLTAGESAFDYGGGLDPSLLVEFKYEHIKEGKYTVTILNDLPPGEYCFFYANARATQRSTKELNLIAFDFGVK
jgi:hypothetical protein